MRDQLKKALETNDYETLKNKIGELEQAAAMMAQYANQAGAASGADTTTDTTTSTDGTTTVTVE